MRMRTIDATAVNVVLQPHSPEKYTELLKDAARLHRMLRVRAPTYAMLSRGFSTDSRRSPGKQNATAVHTGSIVTATRVDLNAPWVDVRTGKQADDQDTSKIVLPDHLWPNRKEFRFRFFTSIHLMVVETKSRDGLFTPGNVLRFVDALFNQARLVEKYGEVEVTLLPEHETLSRILRGKIRWIELQLKRPNADDLDEKELLERLDLLGVGHAEHSYTARPDATIEPDEQMKQLAAIASRNGKVNARLLQGGRTVKVSTQDRPLLKTKSYDPEVEHESGAFEALADALEAEEIDARRPQKG